MMTDTIGRFIGELIGNEAWSWSSGDPGKEGFSEIINGVMVDTSDPSNLQVEADGARFAVRIVRIG